MSSPSPLPSSDGTTATSVFPTSHSARYEAAGMNRFGLSLRITTDKSPPPIPLSFLATPSEQQPPALPWLPQPSSAASLSADPSSLAPSPPPPARSPLLSTPPALPVRPARPLISPLSGSVPTSTSVQPASLSPSPPSPSMPPPLPSVSVSGVPVLPLRPFGATHRVTASSGAILTSTTPTQSYSPSAAFVSSGLSQPPQPRRFSADKRPSPASAMPLMPYPLPRQLFATMNTAGLPVLLSDDAQQLQERRHKSQSVTDRQGPDDATAAATSPTAAQSALAPSSPSHSSSSASSSAASASDLFSKPSSRSSSPYSSLPSLFPSSSRVRVACELADTERTYVSSLRVLVRLFIEPLSRAAATDKRHKAPLSTEQVNVLFSNAKLIFSLNESFHHSLSARLTGWLSLAESEQKVGDVIAQFAPYFKLYSQYCSTFDASQRLLGELSQSNSAFQSYVSRIARKSGHKFQSLASLLIQPIQRVPRYKLLLEQLLKFTAGSHPDLPLLTAALTQISVTASHINEAVRRREAMDAMVAIEERFMSSPGFVHASRVFLRQAALAKVGKSGAAKQEHFFLFNDLLASARSVMGRYVLRKKIAIDSHFCLGSPHATQHAANAPPTRYGLLILYRDGGCLSLYFQQSADKEAWLADIERCIAQAANTIQAADRDREQHYEASSGGSLSQPLQSQSESDKVKDRDEEQKEGSSSSSADRQCALCGCAFSLFNRRHSCRQCGRAVCGDCSRSRLILHAEERRPERVCDGCALSAESLRPVELATNGGSGTVSAAVTLTQPSSPSSASSSRSLSSRGGGNGHHYSPSCSLNLPALADVPEHSQQASNLQSPSSAVAFSPSSSSSLSAVVLAECVGVAASRQAKRVAAHSRAASSSAALLAGFSEPIGPYPPLSQWDCGTLLRWLCEPEIGFEEFVEGFAKFHVDGPLLLELTDAELRDEIGMREQLHRKRLRKLVDRLANGPTLPASPQPPVSSRAAANVGSLTDDHVPKGIWKANYHPVALTSPGAAVGAATTTPSAFVLPTAAALSSSAISSASLSTTSPSTHFASSALPASLSSGDAAPHLSASAGALTGPSNPTPAMPKRAAPSLPQRQRNTAVSERWTVPAIESRESRCGKCGRLSDTSGLKFCSNCGTLVSEFGRESLDGQQQSQLLQGATALVSSASSSQLSSSSSSRRSSSSSGPEGSNAGCASIVSRGSNSIAQRAALFEHFSNDT